MISSIVQMRSFIADVNRQILKRIDLYTQALHERGVIIP